MCDTHRHEATTTAAGTPAPEASGSSHCGVHSQTPGAVTPQPATARDDLAECPVMPGSVVDKAGAEAAGLYRDHEGRRYWFCCAACGPMWDADPAAYATT